MDKLDQDQAERDADTYARRLIAAARPQAGDGRTAFACPAYRLWIARRLPPVPTKH